MKHGIRTKKQLLREKTKMDAMTFDMEYNNLMIGGSENVFFSFELVSEAQRLKKAWYPKTTEEYFENKKTRVWDIPKQKGEIRVVSMDVALSASSSKIKNDNTVIKCIRGLVSGENYERQEVYTETFEGKDTLTQSIRVRQILEDFEGDHLVLDAKNVGLSMLDDLGKVIYDEERDKEYVPIKCFNDDRLAERCKNPNASPIIYGFLGSADTNHQLHFIMKDVLAKGKLKLLTSNIKCKEEYLSDKREYQMASPEEKARLELPYLQSDMTLNEMINLNQEYIQGGKLKLKEPSSGTKDRYMCLGMANVFIQDLELDLQKTTESNIGDYFFF